MMRAPASDTSCFDDILRAAASGTSNDELLYEVRWLEWKVFESNSYLPPFNLHLPKLSVLMLWGSGVTQDWKEWSSFMASKRLKVLVFKDSPNLRSTPDLSTFTQLKILKFSRCWAVEHLHPSIGKLTSLVSLDLSYCKHLEELPQAIGKLTSLVSLDLSYCKHLKELPQEVGELKDLEELYLAGTTITEIPTFIGSLRKLKKLVAPYCYSLREIPSSIGDLQNLQHLDLDRSAIETLPSAIGSLRKLEKLSASECSSLREIPSSIGDLQNLQHLDLSWSAIEKLPSAIGDLQNLQHLDLTKSGIEKLPSEICDLPSLQILDIGDVSICDLPKSIRNLSSLQSLRLDAYNKLCSLPELPSSLTNLVVCCQSPTLPQLSSLTRLKDLYLGHCDLLEDIPELSSRLLKLTIFKCDKLRLLKLDRFKYLEDFSMARCTFIERLDLSCLKHLKELWVEHCDNLVEIQGPNGAKFSEPLDFMGCKSMETLPDLNACQRLRRVEVKNCKKLTQLRGFEKLDINDIDIWNTSGCDSLESTGPFDNYEQ